MVHLLDEPARQVGEAFLLKSNEANRCCCIYILSTTFGDCSHIGILGFLSWERYWSITPIGVLFGVTELLVQHIKAFFSEGRSPHVFR